MVDVYRCDNFLSRSRCSYGGHFRIRTVKNVRLRGEQGFERHHQRLRPSRRRLRPHALLDEVDTYKENRYDPDVNGAYWSRRPVTVLTRTLQIGLEFGRWYLGRRFGGGGDVIEVQQAGRLREVLTQLGPAFVKIGQAVSSRPDLLPPIYTRELEKLQDQIPPFPDADAMAVLQQELRSPLPALFSELSTSPIAAASLGQVYKGRLREGGRSVAVKVQRPGVREAIALDVFILRWLAGQLRTFRRLNSDLPRLLDEWASSLFRELDYRQEASNGARFAELYADMEGVYVPEMLMLYTTQRVLVMEWVEGVRLRSAGMGASAATRAEDLKLVDVGVRCSLEQMLEKGFYHSDPHPGNLFRTPDGQLAYIDFGMMGEIQPPVRRGLIRATLHMVNREFGLLADDFVDLGLLPPGSDAEAVVPALTQVFSKALAGGVSNVSFSSLSADLGATMYQYNFRIPPYYTLLVRSLSVLEGIALSSDPNYKVLGATYPWIARRMLTDPTGELRETLQNLLYKDGRFQFERLESLLRQAVRSRPRTAANDADQGARALDLVLGPHGGFLRDILAEELAKGLDASWRTTADDLVANTRRSLLSLLGVDGASPAVQWEQMRGMPGDVLLNGIMSLPSLADADDRRQVDGLLQLATSLEDIASSSQPSGRPSSVAQPFPLASSSEAATLQALVPHEIVQAAALLEWFARETAALPPSARIEALRLPASIAARVTSRLTARALRTVLLTAPPLRPRPQPPQIPNAPRISAPVAPTPPPPRPASARPATTPTPSPPAMRPTAPPPAPVSGGNGVARPQGSASDERLRTIVVSERVERADRQGVVAAPGVVVASTSGGMGGVVSASPGNGRPKKKREETVMVALPLPPPSQMQKALPENATKPGP